MATTQTLQLIIKAKNEATKQINKLGASLSKANQKLKENAAAFRKAGLVSGAFGVATGFAIKKLIDVASDAEEIQGKFNVVFRGMEDDVNAWAEDFAKNTGRARQDIKNFSAGIADVLKPMGLQTGAAAKMSQEMVKLALDVASFNNKQDEDVIRAFTSALTGERESLKTLGIVISEADVKQEAYTAGLAKQGEELSKTAKAQATMNLLFKNSSDAQGDLARTGESFANQQKRLQGEIKNLAETMGNILLPIATKIVAVLVKLTEKFNNLSPRIQKIIIVGIAVAAALALLAAPILLLISVLPIIVAGFAAVGAAIALLFSPIGLAIALTAALAAAWATDFGGIRTLVSNFFDGVVGIVVKGTELMKSIFSAATDFMFKSIEKVIAKIQFAINIAKKVGGGIKGAFSSVASTVVQALPGFANGGRTPINEPIIVGERGPEVFMPNTAGGIIPNNQLGGGGFNLEKIADTIVIREESDIQKIANAVLEIATRQLQLKQLGSV